MPIILAVEPDRRQAAHLAAIVRHQVGAELVIADTTERALDELGARVPDMVLVPALLSPQDDAALAAALRVIATAARVRTLTIPVLANGKKQTASGGLLSRLRRGRPETSTLDGCDPAVFAEQITAYLQEAAAERAELGETPAPIVTLAEPPVADGVAAVDRWAGEAPAEKAVGDTWVDEAPVERVVADSWAEEAPVARAVVHAWAEEPLAERAAELEDEPVQLEEPAVDLSDELVALSVDSAPQLESPQEDVFAGEPFGTYTLPSVDEIGLEPSVLLEPVEALEPRITNQYQELFASPVAFEEPAVCEPETFEAVLFDSPVAFELQAAIEPSITFETPAAFERTTPRKPPVPFESPIASIEWPVNAFEPLVARDTSVVSEPMADTLESPLALESPVVFEPPAVAEAAALRAQPVWSGRAATIDLSPTGLSSWRAWPPLEGVPIEVSGIPVPKVDVPVVPDWSELMASLREDMARRRRHDKAEPLRPKTRSQAAKPLIDEWGFFDPEQCGFSALLAKLDEITTA